MDVGYNFSAGHKVYASIARAFRVPTYTELFYSDPNNRGNAALRAEKAWTFEVGHRLTYGAISTNFSLFRRESENLIDWVFSEAEEVWLAQNITAVNTNGFEVGLTWRRPTALSGLRVKRIDLSYSYLHSNKNVEGLTSRYSINHLRHDLIAGVGYDLLANVLSQSWRFRYEDRLQFDDQVLINY